MKKIISGDENLLNTYLSRKQCVYIGTDIVK